MNKNISAKEKKYKKINVLIIVSFLIIGYYFAISRIYTSDFVAINGDFQNYNIFRRIINGELPYKDFINYLGWGVIIVNVPFLLLMNNFTASLFITNFTSAIIFCLSIYIFFRLFINNKKLLLLIINSLILIYIFRERIAIFRLISQSINLITPGNSMRMTRAFLPFLLVGIFCIIRRYNYYINNKEIVIKHICRSKRKLFLLGSIVGAMVYWSNDFGFACIGSLIIIIFILLLLDKDINIFLKFYYFIMSILGVGFGGIIGGLAFTGGNLYKFITVSSQIASYQFWYYGMSDNKLLTVKDIFKNKIYIICIVIFLIYSYSLLVKLINKKIRNNDILAYFIYLSTFIASIIYLYGSGGYLIEVFLLCTLNIIGIYVFKLIEKIYKNRKFFSYIINFIIFITMLFNITLSVKRTLILKDIESGVYVEELKGYTKFGESLIEAKEIIGDENVFSTYASALEVMTNQYHPTGIDYIIHALGDNIRDEYLMNFISGHYKYATTIRNDYTIYEYWIERANWFFYRELYRRYAPIALTDYSIIWGKSNEINEINEDYTINIKKIDDTKQEITINIPSSEGKRVIADLKISYSSKFTSNRWSSLAFRRIVSIEDENKLEKCYYIPNNSDGHYVPLIIENGVGKLILSSKPSECTKLEDIEVEVLGILNDINISRE